MKNHFLNGSIIFLALFAFLVPVSVFATDDVTAEEVQLKERGHEKVKDSDSDSITTQAYAGIATLTIFADPSASSVGSSGLNYDFGTHAFITVKNISTSNITVGKLGSIAPGKTVSIGTWGNKSEHRGLWYNLESYFVYKSNAYTKRVSYATALTEISLATLNTYIKNNDYWSNTTNCSSFAAGAWNAVAVSTDKISAGVPSTPKNLANNIKSKWPTQYRVGYSVPYSYIVYYAQGNGTPIKSTIYK